MVHVIRGRATGRQVQEMLQAIGPYIKLAVDVRRGILAGGGILHADCKAALLEDGSRQEDVWGADWNPVARQVSFEALINIRTGQDDPSLDILDPAIRERVAEITQQILGET
jgi:hypothetical protein